MFDLARLQRTAVDLDAADTLADIAKAFQLPPGIICLDGNSLGPVQPAVVARLAHVMTTEWGTGLIKSWSAAGWFRMPIEVGNRIAPLIGVGVGEVAVGDSTSVNLFKCLAAALHLRPDRHVILAEGGNFPSDSYMAQGLARLVERVSIHYVGPGERIEDRIDAETAVVLASHVDYHSAAMKDMASINRAAHRAGALTVWDLSHSTGAVPVALSASNADMAVGCTYKYLNGGPGAPAYAWVAPRLLPSLEQPLSGWMGHADPFAFKRDYEAADGARRLVCGTPQILSLAALDEALKIWERLDKDQLFAKARTMNAFFIEAAETLCAGFGLALVGPRDMARRGSHVAFNHPHSFAVVQALIKRGVIGDFRAPTAMRFGFAPLYLSFADVLRAVIHLREVLTSKEYDRPEFRVRGEIT